VSLRIHNQSFYWFDASLQEFPDPTIRENLSLTVPATTLREGYLEESGAYPTSFCVVEEMCGSRLTSLPFFVSTG
jgi:hypothetical protein